jgi:outer membrane protein assembly factor BamA
VSTLLTWLVLTMAPAAAQPADPGRWVGVPLADVQLVGPEGGLPEASLAPLLRAVRTEVVDPQAIRLDLATLFQVGRFRAVEAQVEPWVLLDDDGEPIDAAILTYVVYPAPRVSKVRVTGNEYVRARQILDQAKLSSGQVFYAEQDAPLVADRVERWLYGRGFTDASVKVRAVDTDDGLEVELAVVEGEPNLLTRLTFVGDLEGVATDRQLRRWARKAGVEEGEPFTPQGIAEARESIRRRLGDIHGGLFRPSRGWLGARVTPAVVSTPDGAMATFTVEPGPQLLLEVDGLSYRPRHKALQALAIDHRTRLTRGFLDEAPRRLEGWLAEQSYYAAEVDVSLVGDARAPTQTLAIDIDRGPPHALPTGRFPTWVGIDFDGNTHVTDAELQAVMDQASPEVLRNDIYTEPAMGQSLDAARALYRSRGYLEADLGQDDAPVVRKRHGVVDLVRVLTGRSPRRRIEPTVTVEEGPITLQSQVEVTGSAVELPQLPEIVDAYVGQPYSGQAMEMLSRQILEDHRQAGYLDADTRVEERDDGPGRRAATVVVDPGEQVLLRSTVTNGTRRTRPAFLLREVDLQLGQPIRSSDLESLRSDLYDLGIFRTVDLDLLGDDAARDLVITVDERARWAFEVGGGLNTDQGLRTFGRATRRNLWGLAHRLDLVGQIGLDYRSEDVRDWVPDITQPEWRAAISYTAPRFPTRGHDLILDIVLRERRQELTWEMDRTGAGAALETQSGRTRLRGAARIERRQLREVDPGALLPGEVWADLVDLDDPVLPTRWRYQEQLTSLFVLDLRDDPVRPTAGLLLSLNGELSPGVQWSPDLPRTSYIKGDLRTTAFVPLWGLILKLSGEAGLGRSLSDAPIPLEDRYRLGGTGSLRGYRRDAVGPRNLAPDVQVDWPDGLQPVIDYTSRNEPARWVPTGGDAMSVNTAELLMPLASLGATSWDGYALAAFVDVGQVWLTGADADSEGRTVAGLVPAWRYGVGAGVRIATPVGPLQLDVAANPQVWGSEGAQRQLLSVLWEEPPVRAHLTLGATF